MIKYIIKKILISVVVIFGISIIIFYLINLQPGNPYSAMITPGASPEVFEAMLERLGYYDPIYIRYWKWISTIFSGELGYSINFSKPVDEVILNRLPNTIILSGLSIIFTLVLSIFLGYFSAIKKNSFVDKIISTFSIFGISIPTFFYWLVVNEMVGV